MSQLSRLSRIRGCIVGGALGDAIGLWTEFMPRSQCLEIYGSSPRFTLVPTSHSLYPKTKDLKDRNTDRHRAAFKQNSWTDDTDQTLLILLSFLRSGGQELSPLDFAKRLHAWVQFGLRPLDKPPLGLGTTVGAVVRDSRYLDDPIGLAKE
jgi:ADP-ribosylglycohydrolase